MSDIINLTTESPKLQYIQTEFSYNPMRRWVARWIDTIILIFVYASFFLVGAFIMSKYFWNEYTYLLNNSEQYNNLFLNIIVSLILVLPCLYYPLSLKFFGQTVGQKIVSLKLVTINDNKPSFWRIVGRMMCNQIPVSELISTIMVFVREDKKSLYDLICKTKNIQFKTQKNILAKSIIAIISCLAAVVLGFFGLYYFFQAVPMPKVNIKPVEINASIGYEIVVIEKNYYQPELTNGFVIINEPTETKQIEVSKILIQRYSYGTYQLYNSKSNIREIIRDWKPYTEATGFVGTLNHYQGMSPVILGGTSSNISSIEVK
jgi:uncharacterized RDD family membrane protein YckC